MSPLAALIHADIAAHGPMLLSRYWQLCLAHPEHGYYRKQVPIGAAGDFTTAPEISQMFGELIGLWLADLWQRAGAPDPINLIELGPGRGTLMADAWRATKAVPGFHAAARVHFVETSPALRAEQAKRVPHATWHEALPVDLSPALIVANEFFDALPIEQVNAADTARRVLSDGAQLRWSFPDEHVVREVRPLSMALPARAVLLAIDYGADAVDRDTLQAVRGHRFVDPLDDPGDADLTSHVDFGALAAAFPKAVAYGPASQGQFLRALGLDMRLAQLVRANPALAEPLRVAAARLSEPDQMGSLFKAMALCQGDWPEPLGFAR
jgi:NADH dehydrogenase [ubiquinone] 1 alpha subcomplex assembly factor 7